MSEEVDSAQGKTNERSPLKNDIYSTGNFDWEKKRQWDKEWNVAMKMNIKELRLLYSTVSFYLNNYTGAPERPPEEEDYLEFLQTELYKMITEYNFSHHALES